MGTGHNRIYAKINLDAVSYNMHSIEEKLSGHTGIIAVVKADGYGHGACEIAKEIEPFSKLFGFAAATADEALSLKKCGVQKPVLILGYTFSEDYEELLRNQIRPTVYSYEMAQNYAKAAQKTQTTARLHIKIDTGMSRIGYQVTEASADEIAEIAKLPGIKIEGAFTHFARADEKDKSHTHKQIQKFQEMMEMLQARGVIIPLKHCSNSAGIAEIPEANMDLVRAGIILYGLWPSEEVDPNSISLKPVMELKSRIVHIKTLEPGRAVSYGGTYLLKEPRTIATVPAGYADGYPRSLSQRGYVLIHGKKAPILGRVCMDQFMVDITDIQEAKLLDTVTLLGEDEGSVLSMEELGKLSGRFNYEFACDVGKRIPRIFYKKNEPISIREYFNE